MTTGRDVPADQATEESGGTAAWAGSTSSVVEGPFLDPASVRLPEGAKYVRAFVPTDGSTPFWRVYDADDQVIGTQPVDAPPPAVDPALSAAIDAWHAACHAEATIEDGMRRVVEAVRAVEPEEDDEDRPEPLTAEDGKRIMAQVAAHPRRDVIEALAESMYDLANENEGGPGGGMWHWLSYAHAVVEGVPELYVAKNVPAADTD